MHAMPKMLAMEIEVRLLVDVVITMEHATITEEQFCLEARNVLERAR